MNPLPAASTTRRPPALHCLSLQREFHGARPGATGVDAVAGKPLADIGGAPMVVRVAQRAATSAARRVVVAADDRSIVEACAAHGVEAILTRPDHATGSDRLAEACELLGLRGDDIVVNVQGDEPLIEPSSIDACADLLSQRTDCVMSTVAHRITAAAEFHDPNVVKVVVDGSGRALLFSRAAIPCWRDAPTHDSDASQTLPTDPPPLRHVGVYGYRVAFLRQFAALPACALERTESLEQLRVLWIGERIAVHVSATSALPGVDTPADLERMRALFRTQDLPGR